MGRLSRILKGKCDAHNYLGQKIFRSLLFLTKFFKSTWNKEEKKTDVLYELSPPPNCKVTIILDLYKLIISNYVSHINTKSSLAMCYSGKIFREQEKNLFLFAVSL